jgi:hypothetical protein
MSGASSPFTDLSGAGTDTLVYPLGHGSPAPPAPQVSQTGPPATLEPSTHDAHQPFHMQGVEYGPEHYDNLVLTEGNAEVRFIGGRTYETDS